MASEDISESLSTTINKERGNKRKSLSDVSVEAPIDESASPLNEFHGHKALIVNESGSLALGPENVAEEEEEDDLPEYDWEKHTTQQLEGLMTNNLLGIFQTAIKKVVECGYNEVTAGWAVLNSGLSRGGKDVVSNIVDGALTLLKTENECNIPRKPVFEGLRSLVEYFVLEMTNVILEAKPELTIPEAMRCLLKNDMNLTMACLAAEGSRPNSSSQQGTSHSSNRNQGKEPMLGSTSPCPKTPIHRPPLYQPNCSTHLGKNSSISIKELRDQLCHARDHVRASAQSGVMNEKLGVGIKAKSKKDKSWEKSYQLEKGHKDHVSEDNIKAKVTAWGNMVLEKSLKSQSNLLTKIAEAKASKPDVLVTALPVKETISASTEAKSKPPQDPRLKDKTIVSESKNDTDYYAGMSYDETLQKHIPQGEKDKDILTLLPRKQELEKMLQYWSDWVKEKITQAAKRLAQDQGELKTLRQAKQEDEKCNKEKQTMEDNAKRRIFEMETALSKASCQIEASNSYFRRLQEDQYLLRKKMGVSNLRATEAVQYLEEAVVREQDAIIKCQPLDNEKSLYMDRLTSAKQEVAELNNRFEKIRERRDQFQVLLRQEEREKLQAIAKYDSLRSKRDRDEALAIAEAENITKMAETNIEKTKEDIKNLENMISEWRLETERSKIAALSVGYGSCSSSNSDDFFTFRGLPKITKRLPAFENNFGSGSVKSNRECIMCMCEEISVVFLPCAHQVLCVECNIRHEKQGMNDCPSCRTMIERRIPIKYCEF